MTGALALLGCVLWVVIRGTRRCPRGFVRYQLRRKLFGVVSRDYALLDAGNQAWAAAAGAFPRHFTLTSNRTRDAPLRMDCSGITSCLNLYPTYALTTPSGGPHGTLRQELDLIKTYSLSLSTGAAYGAELDALTSAAVSTRYTVRDGGGRAVAQIQKELGGCSFHGSEPGLSACFKVCVAADDDAVQSSTTLMMMAIGIAVDQNHP